MNRLLAIFFFAAVMLSASAPGAKSQTQIRYLSGTGKDDVSWDFSDSRAQERCLDKDFRALCVGSSKALELTTMAAIASLPKPLANEQGKYRLRFAVPIQ
jgi:hypothetical protein